MLRHGIQVYDLLFAVSNNNNNNNNNIMKQNMSGGSDFSVFSTMYLVSLKCGAPLYLPKSSMYFCSAYDDSDFCRGQDEPNTTTGGWGHSISSIS